MGVGPELISFMSSIQDISPVTELNVGLEEADIKLIPHTCMLLNMVQQELFYYTVILMSWYWHYTTGTF